jgi:hypothetical protein
MSSASQTSRLSVRAILAGDEVDVDSARDLLEQRDAALGDSNLAATLQALVAQ